MMRLLIALILIALAAGALPAGAVEPGEELANPALELRARALSKELRCLVCQNQSIDDSNADLARDLRLLVRERLSAGLTDEQVVAHIVARYGDFVLLRPPVKPTTYLLWVGPALILIIGLGAIFVFFRRRQGSAAAPLSAEEQARLADLMKDEPRP